MTVSGASPDRFLTGKHTTSAWIQQSCAIVLGYEDLKDDEALIYLCQTAVNRETADFPNKHSNR